MGVLLGAVAVKLRHCFFLFISSPLCSCTLKFRILGVTEITPLLKIIIFVFVPLYLGAPEHLVLLRVLYINFYGGKKGAWIMRE